MKSRAGVYLLGVLALTPVSAFADEPNEDLEWAQAWAQMYRNHQPKSSINGWQRYVGEVGQGLSAASSDPVMPVVYDMEVIGDGMDALTGSNIGLCWDTSKINVRTETRRQGSSDFTLVKDDYSLSRYLQQQASLSVSGGVGMFSGSASASAMITHEANISTNTVSIVARYDYVLGSRWMGAPLPPLGPVFQGLLDKGDLGSFREQCGNTFLQQADDGAALMVVFVLTKTHEDHSTEEELKAAFQAKYGNPVGTSASVSGSAGLTERQKEILDSYTINSRCYVQGGDQRVCKFIRDQNDISSALDQLMASLCQPGSNTSGSTNASGASNCDQNGNIVTIHAGYASYADRLGRADLGDFQPRLAALEGWEQHRATVHLICNSVNYLPCDPLMAEIDTFEKTCKDVSQTCTQVTPSTQADTLNEGYLGEMYLYQDANYSGRQLRFAFRVDGKDPNALQPGVLYSLYKLGMNDMVSAINIDSRLLRYWSVELYENADGSGEVWSSQAQLYPTDHALSYIGDWFNDKASSFRIVRRQP